MPNQESSPIENGVKRIIDGVLAVCSIGISAAAVAYTAERTRAISARTSLSSRIGMSSMESMVQTSFLIEDSNKDLGL
ncbi:MAG: hypothetical protein NTX80_01655 [Candidatus Saccharibacteria bacterium]|nr:hypothetical protein [Candidatus Saccharibacteria bacterium]